MILMNPKLSVSSTVIMSSRSSQKRKRKPVNNGDPKAKLSKTTTTTTKSTGPYDRTFQQHLIDHYILPCDYEYLDETLRTDRENLDEILKSLARPRASLSPSRFSNDDYRRFRRTAAHAYKENQVMADVMPIIYGKQTGHSAGAIPFTNLEPLTDGTIVLEIRIFTMERVQSSLIESYAKP